MEIGQEARKAENFREPVMLPDDHPSSLSEPLIERLVHTFYGRVREDALIGPIFEARLAGRWDAHLAKMIDFWSSIALRSGRYFGRPHVAHQDLGLDPAHFQRWLTLFEETARAVCDEASAAFFIDRAHRIADSLQIGLNIGPKALRFAVRSASAGR
jgi:hemoglobin